MILPHEDHITELTKTRVSLLYPALQKIAFQVCKDMLELTGRVICVTSGVRSMSDQLTCYSMGRRLVEDKWQIVDASKIVTNAMPGLSWHNYGLAFDIAFSGIDSYLAKEPIEERKRLWSLYGKIGKSYGCVWGGDFHIIHSIIDCPHLEKTWGLRLDQAMALFHVNGIQGVWDYLNNYNRLK